MKNLHLLVKMEFGSHLYGTTVETSDKDYKGVFIPSADEILACRIPKSVTFSSGNGHNKKNTSSDVDDDVYSLPYFLELALKGETVALDMLHADNSSILTLSHWWGQLRDNRWRFYTKRLNSFVGYTRKQAAKYGIKGSRLDAVKRALDFATVHYDKTVGEVYDQLWEDEHCRKYNQYTNLDGSLYSPHCPVVHKTEPVWEVCGKKMMARTKFSTYVPMLKKFYENYGERARLAAVNQGVDWKAVSHALRAGYQARSIFLNGTFSYPLQETPYLVQVKSGALNYRDVAAHLDALMDQLEDLSNRSSLPDTPDYDWATQFLKDVHGSVIRDWLICNDRTLELLI